jgi:UDP-N-acetylmuramate: L-alanyl-gamma-D-glutamyl-meso-diaminopimelate ligase
VACSDDPRVRGIAAHAQVPIRFYGSGPDADWSAVATGESLSGISVTMLRAGRQVAEGILPVFGSHNVSNALAAVAATDCVGVSPADSLAALAGFQGVRRRQEILGEEQGILVMDDFAHHPSAVEATCAAIRSRFQNRRLVAVFEPRTNTSRRSVFQDLYVPAFRSADLVVLREPRDVENLPESDRFSSERLVSDLRGLGQDAEAFETTDGVVAFLAERLSPGDVVLVMSNGSFDNLCGRLLETLRGREP